MARFRSGFERLIELRESQEQQAKAAVAGAAAEELRRAGELDEARSRLQLAGQMLRGAGQTQAGQLAAAAAFVGRLKQERAGAESRLVEAQHQRQVRSAEAVACWQATRTLEVLRSRRHELWLRRQAAAEQREIDDMTAAGWQGRARW